MWDIREFVNGEEDSRNIEDDENDHNLHHFGKLDFYGNLAGW